MCGLCFYKVDSMLSLKPTKFFLPGVFLLFLAVGNIGVGVYRSHQYDEVMDELRLLEPSRRGMDATSLRRIQLAENSVERLYQRQKVALGRRDFYQLVTFGGQIFLAISFVLILFGAVVQLFQQRRWNTNKTEVISS